MGKLTASGTEPSRIVWGNLEEWVRRKVQEFIQSLLEEEITEALLLEGKAPDYHEEHLQLTIWMCDE